MAKANLKSDVTQMIPLPNQHAQLNRLTPTTQVLNMVRRTHLPARCQTISTGFHHSSAAFAIQQGLIPTKSIH
jgi:hypothetical protein